MGEAMQVQAASPEIMVNAAVPAAAQDSAKPDPTTLGLVKEFLAFLNQNLDTQEADSVEVEPAPQSQDQDNAQEGKDQAWLQLLQDHPDLAAVLIPMMQPTPAAVVQNEGPAQTQAQTTTPIPTDLEAVVEALQAAVQGQADVKTAPASTPAGIPEKVQVMKRDQTGVQGMLNDFPQGWESLLEEGAAPEKPDATAGKAHSDSPKSAAVPTGAAAEATAVPQPVLSLDETSSRQQDIFSLADKGGDPRKNSNNDKAGHDLSFPESTALATMDRSSGLEAGMRPVASGSLELLKAMSEVQHQGVIKAFSHDLVKGAKGKEEKLHIELNPPELGRVEVTVHRSGGQIHAKVFMADKHLGEFFHNNIDQIKKNLETSGMKVGTFSLEVGQQQQQHPGQGSVGKQDQEEGWGESAKGLSITDSGRVGAAGQGSRIKTSRVDMFI